MVDGGGGRGRVACHRFCPPPPGVATPLGAESGAPRAAREFTVNVPTGQGVLAIRDADETQALASPTRITGTVDDETGVISGATLSTPPLEFDTVVLGGIPVRVKATFIQVTPGGGTGLVAATPPAAPDGQDQKGQVVLRDSVKVSLNLRIGNPLILEANCETPPVQLELLSDGPYTQTAGGRIVDPDFGIPPVPVNNATGCINEVASNVNSLLGGPGHSLSMVIKGDLPVPELKPETTTTLTADPADGSMRGTEVTLTAAVAPVEPNDLDPTGAVVFKEGTRTLGTAELEADGTASLTTKELRTGTRDLVAEYQGDAEFAPSMSEPLSFTVAPAPIVTGTFPERIVRDAAPVEFDVTVDNRGSTRSVPDARVDVVFTGLTAGWVTLERKLGDGSWAPVPLAFEFSANGTAGTLGPVGGSSLAAGAVQTHRLRVAAVHPAEINSWSVDFKLVSVDPGAEGGSLLVAANSWSFGITRAGRVTTATEVRTYDAKGLRPGQTLYAEAYVTTTSPGDRVTTGQVEFLLDGRVVPFRLYSTLGPLPVEQTRGPVDPNGMAYARIILPSDLSTGPHLVSARYLGDASHLPSTPQGLPGDLDGPYVLPILDPLGPLYTCDFVTIVNDRMGAYVQAYLHLPPHAVDGAELDLEDIEVTLLPGGIDTTGPLSNLPTGGGAGVEHIEIDLGGAGTITGDSVAYEADYDTVDQVVRLQGLEGTVVVDGQPGEVMPLPIERIQLTGKEVLLGSNFTFTCLPQAEPVVVAEVGVAGVSLAVASETDPVRVGQPVTLTATAAPVGRFGEVEFFSGSESLGTVSGASGTASITVDDLPVGANSLSARYTGVAGSPYTSNVVQLDVQPAVECAAFAESGHGATVRLVYIELLGRCPDRAGFDYWTGRLAGGTSPEVFARSIARTPEAVGQVVDDAYRTMLGRAPDAAGRAFWVNRMRTGSGRYDQLLADLGASAEFWNLSGATRAGFVTRVYQQLLNRAPDEPGLDYWVARLTPGASRRTLILSLANLDEPLGRLVGLSYDEILGRTPSGTERTDGIGVLRRTGDRPGFYAQLIGQPEFSTRAQGFPNSED